MTPQEIKEAALTTKIADGWRALHDKVMKAVDSMPVSVEDFVPGYCDALEEVEALEERLATLRKA